MIGVGARRGPTGGMGDVRGAVAGAGWRSRHARPASPRPPARGSPSARRGRCSRGVDGLGPARRSGRCSRAFGRAAAVLAAGRAAGATAPARRAGASTGERRSTRRRPTRSRRPREDPGAVLAPHRAPGLAIAHDRRRRATRRGSARSSCRRPSCSFAASVAALAAAPRGRDRRDPPADRGRAARSRRGSPAAIAPAGAVVVSGLAVGIDGAAHAAAVAEGAPTVAVLGSGHGRLYPRAHGGSPSAIVDDRRRDRLASCAPEAGPPGHVPAAEPADQRARPTRRSSSRPAPGAARSSPPAGRSSRAATASSSRARSTRRNRPAASALPARLPGRGAGRRRRRRAARGPRAVRRATTGGAAGAAVARRAGLRQLGRRRLGRRRGAGRGGRGTRRRARRRDRPQPSPTVLGDAHPARDAGPGRRAPTAATGRPGGSRGAARTGCADPDDRMRRQGLPGGCDAC